MEQEMKVKRITALTLLGTLLGSVITAAGADKISQVFIRDAIEGNLAEIQIGQLAQEKAQDVAVKSYGQMLVTDHSASNEEAEKVAKQIGIKVPAEPSVSWKATYDKLSKLSGSMFDRAFLKEMIAYHKVNIARFQNEAKKKNDLAGDFANQMLPILKKHLDTAEKLKPEI
jgi:putative membrane protein